MQSSTSHQKTPRPLEPTVMNALGSPRIVRTEVLAGPHRIQIDDDLRVISQRRLVVPDPSPGPRPRGTDRRKGLVDVNGQGVE